MYLSFTAECEDLDDPEYGDVTLTDGTHQGSLANYSCDADYEISDASVRVCLSTGYWSGWAPTCIPIGRCYTIGLQKSTYLYHLYQL